MRLVRFEPADVLNVDAVGEAKLVVAFDAGRFVAGNARPSLKGSFGKKAGETKI